LDSPKDVIAAIRTDVERAADTILDAAEQGLRCVAQVREGDQAALDQLQDALCAILQACAFQDLTGQRLSQLATACEAGAGGARSAGDPLLNGPALPGEGVDQRAADALMAAFD
jgi:chemotaxis protein CheZ